MESYTGEIIDYIINSDVNLKKNPETLESGKNLVLRFGTKILPQYSIENVAHIFLLVSLQ